MNRRDEGQVVAYLVGVRLADVGSDKDGRKASLLENMLLRGLKGRLCGQCRQSKTYSTGREFIEQALGGERIRRADKLRCQSSNEGQN